MTERTDFRAPRLRWLTLLAICATLSTFSCKSPTFSLDRDQIEPGSRYTSGAAGVLYASNRDGIATSGSIKLRLAKSLDEPKDYWASVHFDRNNFEEVQTFVRRHYIDPNVDWARAYQEAAAFALRSDEKRPLILIPKSFYDARKDHKDERGLLKGKVHKLAKVPGVVIVEEGKIEKEKDKRYSDDEIRQARKDRKARWKLLVQSWEKVAWGERQFKAALDFASLNLGKDPKWSMKRAWVAAARGFLYSLDHHSDLISKEAWDDATAETTDASFEGIGAILTRRQDSDYTIVESPIDGQPALKAGLRAGDIILKVDGTDIRNWLLNKVVKKIRGKKGTKVVLTVSREGSSKPVDVPIIRARIDIKNVSGRLIKHHDGLGYIKLTGFVKTTTSEMVRVFGELSQKVAGLRGLVLDLRRNSGGLLRQGIQVADRFVDDGTIVSVKQRGGRMENEQATPSSWDLPVIVLVDDGSASASEIVASAIQENGQGLVIGDRTFGKASVQTLFNPFIQKDYYIKLTVARYYSPTGLTLQVHGVSPDIAVPPTLDGKMPLGFREEDLSHHLSAITGKRSNPNQAYVERVKSCVGKSGMARKVHDSDPNPAVKFDYQLMYAADALKCMISNPTRLAKHRVVR